MATAGWQSAFSSVGVANLGCHPCWPWKPTLVLTASRSATEEDDEDQDGGVRLPHVHPLKGFEERLADIEPGSVVSVTEVGGDQRQTPGLLSAHGLPPAKRACPTPRLH